MWIMGRITPIELEEAVLNGYITQEEATQIMQL
jgi:hypothetical protein